VSDTTERSYEAPEALKGLFQAVTAPALRSPACKVALAQWIARTLEFQAAMKAFDGSAEQVLVINQAGALYCEALAQLVERVAAIVAQADSAGGARH
jgi:hypothetical protein